MGSMDSSNKKKTIGDFFPTLREGHGGLGVADGGVQQTKNIPLGPATPLANGATYRGIIFVAPCDGCQVKRLMIGAATPIVGGTNTLALDNYDASANTSRNPISTANVNPATLTAREGLKLTRTTTAVNLLMDKGDTLSYVLTVGTQSTPGQGYAMTYTIIVPDLA
jgi:hypothetical protein